MDTWLYVAAFLTAAVGVAHSVLGERYILIRLFRRDGLPVLFGGTEFTANTLRFAWHITTLAWFGLASVFALLAEGAANPDNLLLVLGATFGATGVTALAGSRGRHLSWPVFLAIGGIAIAAFAT